MRLVFTQSKKRLVKALCWSITLEDSSESQTLRNSSGLVLTFVILWQLTVLYATSYKSKIVTMVISWSILKVTCSTLTLDSSFQTLQVKDSNLRAHLSSWQLSTWKFWAETSRESSAYSWERVSWHFRSTDKNLLCLLKWCLWVNLICHASKVNAKLLLILSNAFIHRASADWQRWRLRDSSTTWSVIVTITGVLDATIDSNSVLKVFSDQ